MGCNAGICLALQRMPPEVLGAHSNDPDQSLPSSATPPPGSSGRSMSTAQTTPVIPPANDVEPGEEELSLMVIEESAPLRLPAAEGVGSDSAGAGDHRDGN